MMNNWSYDDIKEDINKIKEIIENENNISKKNIYRFILDQIRDEYTSIFTNNHAPKYNSQLYMLDLSSSFLSYGRYYDFNKKFNDIVNSNDILYNECQDKSMRIKINNSYISDKKCIDMVSSVFMGFDNEFSKIYKEYYPNIKHYVNFLNECYGLDDSYEGFCLYIGVVDKSYILVRDSKGISKPINFAHECGHMVASKYNPLKMYQRKDDFLEEIPSIFFEMLFEYEYSNYYDSFSTSIFNFDMYYFLMEENDRILSHDKLLKEWIKNNYEVNSIFYKTMNSKYGFNRNECLDIMKSTIDNNGKYIIGYLCALHLFHIYKENKNKAFKLLCEILDLRDNDTYSIISDILNYNYINDEVEFMLKDINNNLDNKLITDKKKVLKYK